MKNSGNFSLIFTHISALIPTQVFAQVSALIFTLFFALTIPALVSTANAEEWARPTLVQEVLEGKRTEACASWWGFDPEDSTRFLQAAIRSGVRTLKIDRQPSDWIVTPLEGTSNLELVLASGVVLQAKKGEFLFKGASLFRVAGCENFTIRGEKADCGAVLRMHKADYQAAPYEPAEWRHGLAILSSQNVLIQDLTIEYTGGDGIYLGVCKHGVTNSNVTIRRVLCNENHRQGISVISACNLLIEDTIMRNTNGTAPQAGIDFEPNLEDEELTNCVMRRCVCEGNAGDGFEFYLPNLTANSAPISIVLEDCISRRNARSGLAWTLARSRSGQNEIQPVRGTMTVRNFKTEEEALHGLCIRSNIVNSVKFALENVAVERCGLNSAESSPIHLELTSDAPAAFGDLTFSQVRVEESVSERPFLDFNDASVNAWGLEGIQGELFCTHDGTTEKVTLNKSWIQKNYPIKNTHRLHSLPLETSTLCPLKASEDGAAVSQKIPPMCVRNFIRCFFFAKKGQTLSFALKLCKVGRSGSAPLPLSFTSPGGSKIRLAPLVLNESRTYEVTAEETGIYVLEGGTTPHSFLLESSTLPVALDASRLHLIGSAGDLFFWVPAGTVDFGVCVSASPQERVRASVFAPDGTKCWEMTEIASTEFFYPTPAQAQAGGVWRVHFSRPTQAAFEDFEVHLQNIPPLAAFREDFLLQNSFPVNSSSSF